MLKIIYSLKKIHIYQNAINEELSFNFSLIGWLDVDKGFLGLKHIFLSLGLRFLSIYPFKDITHTQNYSFTT